MTIEQLAAELHVTRQAINNRLNRAGISLADLSAGKQGNKWILSDEGAARIRDMMRGSGERGQAQQGRRQLDEAKEEAARQLMAAQEEARRQREADRQTIDEQAGRIAAMQNDIAQRDKVIETLRETIAQQSATIDGLNKSIQAQAMAIAAQGTIVQRIEAARADVVQVETAQPGPEGSTVADTAQPGADAPAVEPNSKPGMRARLAAWLMGKK